MTPGTRLGRFDLEARVAEGGFGVVYRARDAAGTPVAVKLLHGDLAGHPEASARFEREAKLVALLEHPGVPKLIELGVTDGRPWFAMEWLEGEDLRACLAVRGRLPAEETLAILRPLAETLDAAHARGIVHRDLKPSNVFLAGAAGATSPRVLLLDFGVAKLLDDTRPSLTSSRHVVGTPPCMAPEQILGEPVDARTDVYALGVLAYEMLTGEPPFSHESAAFVMEMHLSSAPAAPSAKVPLPPAVDAVILRALAKAREQRFARAGDFVQALAAAFATRAPGGEAVTGALLEVSFDIETPGVDEILDAASLADALDAVAAVASAAGAQLVLMGGNHAVFSTTSRTQADSITSEARAQAKRAGLSVRLQPDEPSAATTSPELPSRKRTPRTS